MCICIYIYIRIHSFNVRIRHEERFPLFSGTRKAWNCLFSTIGW